MKPFRTIFYYLILTSCVVAENTNDLLFFLSDEKQEICDKVENKFSLTVYRSKKYEIQLAGRLILNNLPITTGVSVTPYTAIKIEY